MIFEVHIFEAIECRLVRWRAPTVVLYQVVVANLI